MLSIEDEALVTPRDDGKESGSQIAIGLLGHVSHLLRKSRATRSCFQCRIHRALRHSVAVFNALQRLGNASASLRVGDLPVMVVWELYGDLLVIEPVNKAHAINY